MKTLSLLVALIAMLAIAVAPASGATKTDRKQNKSIRTLDKRTKSAARQLKSLGSDAAALKGGLATLQGTTASVRTAVDQVSSGLAGLRGTLLGYAAATEYGVVQLYFDPEGNGFEANDAIPGQLLTSSDVPDDTNQSTVSGKLFMAVPDATTAKPVALKAGMRSGEKDGTGGANPVGVAGLMAMTGSMVGTAGTTSINGGNPGASTSLPLTSKPNSSMGGLPVYAIPDKAPRTDAVPNPLGFPDDKTIELTDPAALQTLTAGPARFTVTNTSGSPASAVFDVTVRFLDLSSSSTDLEE